MKKTAFVILLTILAVGASCNTSSNKKNDSLKEANTNTQSQQGAKTNATSWRGPNSTGVYPETGLLKKWPEGGPKVLWKYNNSEN